MKTDPSLQEITSRLDTIKLDVERWTQRFMIAMSKLNEAKAIFDTLTAEGLVSPSLVGTLSAREREVFTLIGQDKSVMEIAAALGMARKTVEAHREHIRKKLGVRTSEELAAIAKM